jgi:chromosome segregation ATPase
MGSPLEAGGVAFAVLHEFEIELRLGRLRRAEAELTARQERLMERIGAFPNPLAGAQYREVSANLAEIENHIAHLEAELLPIRRRRRLESGRIDDLR